MEGTRSRGRSEGRARRPEATKNNPFVALLATIRKDVDGRLLRLLDDQVDAARHHGDEVSSMIAALRDLCGRGGKRLRPGLIAVGQRAVSPSDDLDRALQAGVALELLQAYFLIHDDWMDQDRQRRGGPAVHVQLTRRFRSSHKGAAAAILAGDYAVALATRVLGEIPVPSARLPKILACFADMQLDAVTGQVLDLVGQSRDAEHTYLLKTASYTVRGPLVLGALLGGGSAASIRSLEQFSRPAGVAFQLRDDLIGVFGDPARTGKPRGGDLKAGKRTPLVERALKRSRGTERESLRSVLGNARASRRQVERAIAALEACGAREAVEARITTLVGDARTLLDQSSLSTEGRGLLYGALEALTSRAA